MTIKRNNLNLTTSEFQPAWWLRHRHLQTIYPSFPWSYRHRPNLRREILDLPDGDATAIDWVVDTDELPATAPLLVILHGLESSAQSAYARMLMQAAADQGWHCCVMHFRDCGDYSNRLPRRYHAGETNDVRFFLERLEASQKYGPIAAAGFSLGGNVLLKYLGESASTTPLRAATAVCVPLSLHRSADALNIGFSKIYQSYLIKRMKRSLSVKFDRHTFAFDWKRAMAAATFAEFDDAVTAPLHGFDGKNDYYDRCSSGQFLASIARPTLLLNALDDPFMMPDILDSVESISDYVTIEASERGGHVGFIEGGTPWKPRFYLPRRIIQYLAPYMAMPGL